MHRTLLPLVLLAVLLPAQDPTDAQHARLEIELFPATQTVSGTVTWTVRSLVNGLTTFPLQLHSSLGVGPVTVGGNPVTFTRPTDAVVVTLDRTYNLNEVFTLVLTYSGAPAGAGFGSFVWSSHGPGTPMIFSLSEPYYAYTWWPCKETLTDKFTSETWVTVPSPLTVASNGVLQGTDVLPGSRTRFRWGSNYPIATYGVSLAATDYQIRTDTYTHLGATMPVSFYAYPESFASQQGGMNLLVPMLTVYSNLLGQYPFVNEKYGICQFTWGGGMEHQTITSQYDFGEWLSSHELGHSWWGNSITCATWHDISLNEGFASYMEALWDENKPGGGVSAYFGRMYANRPSSAISSGSVYVTDITSVWSIFNTDTVYHKGSWVLHQLRHVVGDSAFFQLLRDYRAAKEFQSATWQEFRAIASASCGQDLTWFIDETVMRPGAPAYRFGWSAPAIGGQTYVFGNIEQIQGTAPYRFPMDVQVTTGSGQTTSVVWCDQERDDFVLAVNGPVVDVQLDPAPWILREPTTPAPYAASLTASSATVPRTGGTVTLTLNAGPSNASRPYLVGGSGSGLWPGVTLADGKRVPLQIDGFTLAVYQAVNGPIFQNFAGALNGAGQATAQIVVPPLPPIAGPITTSFVFVTTTSPVFVSNPVVITILP